MNEELVELMKIQQKKMETVSWIKVELLFINELIEAIHKRSQYLSSRTEEESGLFFSVHERMAEILREYSEELMKDSDELLESFLKCE